MSNETIDVHVHFGAPKDEESGCFWSEEFTRSVAYFAMLLITKSLFKKVNALSADNTYILCFFIKCFITGNALVAWPNPRLLTQ